MLIVPMDSIRTIKLRWVLGAPGDISYQLARFHFARPTPMWQPAINAYRCEDSIRVCVDLAGVDRSDIELQVEPRRVTLRGARDVPEPKGEDSNSLQMLIMEIDYGQFSRTIELSDEIDVQKARAEQENGWLWIYLPRLS
jgi:HSP20 family protein